MKIVFIGCRQGKLVSPIIKRNAEERDCHVVYYTPRNDTKGFRFLLNTCRNDRDVLEGKMNKRTLGEFGQRIRQLRKVRGLTQERLATKAGLHYTYVGAVERGEKNISLINIKNLAQALEVEVCELFPIINPVRSKEYSLAEEVASYLKTKPLDEIERAHRILRTALEK